MELDLKIMPIGSAMQIAKIKSGLTNKEIALRMGLHESVIKNLFAEHQDRLPDVLEVVAICNALGNRFLMEWMEAQLEDLPPSGGGNIPTQFCRLSDGFSRLAKTTAEALEDGVINASEANNMMLHARDVRDKAEGIMASVAPLAGQIFSHGKWRKIDMMESHQ